MKVAITGAFGNIGSNTISQLAVAGHQITAFDVDTRANRKAARRQSFEATIIWGDIRDADAVSEAVRGQDVVIHLAGIIPPNSERQPHLAQDINVQGARNIIESITSEAPDAKLLFASTCSLFGQTQHLEPPRTVSDPVNPTDHYTRHKAECEQMIRDSSLTWCIFRLGAVLPLKHSSPDPIMFEVPPYNRIEYLHTYDAGLAFSNAATNDEVWGRTLLVGGGPTCQIHQRYALNSTLDAMGIGMLPEEAFSDVPFYTDWMDTSESQRILQYQRHSFDDYVEDMKNAAGIQPRLARIFRPLVRQMMLRKSAYLRNR